MVGDFTYFPTWEGWLYLATVIDCHTKAGEQNTRIAERLDVARRCGQHLAQAVLPVGRGRIGRSCGSGAAAIVRPKVVSEVKAMACEPPVERDVPLSRWSSAELAAQAVTEGLVEAVSASTVRRWLHDAIKPWQHRSWIFLRDPDFGSSRPGA